MKKIDENTKVTLTFAQIKKLVKESTDAKFETDLKAEYKKRLEEYAGTFGYKSGAELEAAMDADDKLSQEVIEFDDGDNFMDLYLNWWPDEEGFAEQDEYYHAPLRDLLEGIVYGNNETDESGRPPRIGKDCYAVNFRNMHTAIHGLFIGTKREMEEVMDILDQIGHTDDPADLEVLYDELGQYDTIEEINFRDIGKDYTFRDWKTDKTYKVLNSSSYDVEW